MRPGIKKGISLLTLTAAVWIGSRWLLPLGLPFLLGAAIAVAAEPVVALCQKKLRMPRGVASALAVSVAVCLLALAVLLLCALMLRELGLLTQILPDLGAAAKSGITSLEQWLLGLSQYLPDGVENAAARLIHNTFSGGSGLLDRGLSYLLALAGGVLGRLPGGALGAGATIISAYMISARLSVIRQWLRSRIPEQRLQRIAQGLKGLRQTLLRFVLAQAQLSGVTFGILLASFLLLRIPYGPVWALAVALVDAFPVLGTGTVLLPWSLIALLQGSGARAAGILGTYVTISVVRSVLEPRLLGRQLGLDPLVTLVAIYAGFRLWGIGGMLLAPLLAVAAVQLLSVREA